MSQVADELSNEPIKSKIKDFGLRVYLPTVVEYYQKNGLSWRKSREKVASMTLSEMKDPAFLGFERTSEIFISLYKDGTWRDKKCKRNWIMFRNSFISHMNFKRE
jgi:hypothetical protein